jgi:predicted phosphodiesterase
MEVLERKISLYDKNGDVIAHAICYKVKNEIDILPSEGAYENFLALCGDIGNPFHENYVKFIRRHSERFSHVFIVAGNHEYYSGQNKEPSSKRMRR